MFEDEDRWKLYMRKMRIDCKYRKLIVFLPDLSINALVVAITSLMVSGFCCLSSQRCIDCKIFQLLAIVMADKYTVTRPWNEHAYH